MVFCKMQIFLEGTLRISSWVIKMWLRKVNYYHIGKREGDARLRGGHRRTGHLITLRSCLTDVLGKILNLFVGGVSLALPGEV